MRNVKSVVLRIQIKHMIGQILRANLMIRMITKECAGHVIANMIKKFLILRVQKRKGVMEMSDKNKMKVGSLFSGILPGASI